MGAFDFNNEKEALAFIRHTLRLLENYFSQIIEFIKPNSGFSQFVDSKASFFHS